MGARGGGERAEKGCGTGREGDGKKRPGGCQRRGGNARGGSDVERGTGGGITEEECRERGTKEKKEGKRNFS